MSKSSVKIDIVAASVAGPQHHYKKMPCQDFFKFHKKGQNFVAVVSDGAGSAKYGKIGAKILCETVIDILKNSDFREIEAKIAHAVDVAREKLEFHRLNKGKKKENLNSFAATLVGVVCNKGKGLFFHIGDGAGVAFDEKDLNKFVASLPENGSFSCETFFFTQENWKENLRITKFEKLDTIILMSDGLTGFAFTQDFRDIEKGFISPIHSFLSNTKSPIRAKQALANTLNNSQARKLNSDDKTLLWARMKA